MEKKHFKGTVTFEFDSYAESAEDREATIMLALDDLMAANENINIDKYAPSTGIDVEEVAEE